MDPGKVPTDPSAEEPERVVFAAKAVMLAPTAGYISLPGADVAAAAGVVRAEAEADAPTGMGVCVAAEEIPSLVPETAPPPSEPSAASPAVVQRPAQVRETLQDEPVV